MSELVDYKQGVQIVSPTPTGAGGAYLDATIKTVADKLESLQEAVDAAGTAEHTHAPEDIIFPSDAGNVVSVGDTGELQAFGPPVSAIATTDMLILSGLGQVEIIAPTDGQILIYNEAEGVWQNNDDSGGGEHTHVSEDITDATNANTPNTIVKRNEDGNVSVGAITTSGISFNNSGGIDLNYDGSIDRANIVNAVLLQGNRLSVGGTNGLTTAVFGAGSAEVNVIEVWPYEGVEPNVTVHNDGTVTAVAFAGDGSALTGVVHTADLSSYVTSSNLSSVLATYATSSQLATYLTQSAAAATYAIIAHSHDIADVTGLQAALDDKVDVDGLADYVSNDDLTDALVLKADKITPAVVGNVATLDAFGNLTDGGVTLASKANASTVTTHIADTVAHGATGAVVGTTNTQTLTNKTLTAPIISSISNTGTLTLPTSTDTIVGRATTDTLTNKSISGATNTLTAIAQSSVTNLTSDLAAKAPLASPTFTGTVTGTFSGNLTGNVTGNLTGEVNGANFDSNATGVGFYAVTPVARAAATDDIKDALTAYGLLQGTSASPLNLDGGAVTAGLGTITQAGLQITSADGLVLQNTTAATASPTMQMSPRIRFRASAWKATPATADTQDWSIEAKPTNGTTTTTSTLQFGYNPNETLYSYPMTLTNAGALTVTSLLTSAISAPVQNGNGISFAIAAGNGVNFFGVPDTNGGNITLKGGTATGTGTLGSVSILTTGGTTRFQVNNTGVGFFAVTPAAQASTTADIKDALTAYGLLTGTSATPLNLDGGTLTAGAAVFSAAANAGVVALTDGATPALNAALGNTFTLSAAGDRTIAVPTNPVHGQKITIQHHASGGARTLALNTGAGGFAFGSDVTALTATASGKIDLIGCIYTTVGSVNKWLVVSYMKGFS